MTRVKKLWVPVLAGLLVARVLGVGGSGAVAAEPRTVTASIMIPTAALIPAYDGIAYSNWGPHITVGSTSGAFAVPLSFPVPVVNIRRITLYAYDNHPVFSVCASLLRSRPAVGVADNAGGVCTANSPDDPQTVYTTAISPRQVNTAIHSPYLWVSIGGPGVWLYGVKITYTYTP